MTTLKWAALFLAALAAVAWWQPDGPPPCVETLPMFGEAICCERHRCAGSTTAAAIEAEHRARLRRLVARP